MDEDRVFQVDGTGAPVTSFASEDEDIYYLGLAPVILDDAPVILDSIIEDDLRLAGTSELRMMYNELRKSMVMIYAEESA